MVHLKVQNKFLYSVYHHLLHYMFWVSYSPQKFCLVENKFHSHLLPNNLGIWIDMVDNW